MTKEPMTVRLYRENHHIEEPSIASDVRDIVAVACLALLLVVIVIVVLA